MYVVDACVWVGRFVRKDAHHLPSRSWLDGTIQRGETMALPAIALPEISGSVARQTNSTGLGAKAVSLIQELPNVRLVPVDRLLAELAAKSASELRLRGADAIYIALASYLGIPLVTWDNELIRRGGYAVDTTTPLELNQALPLS
ncbi:MAG: PIN domain-containing protein [Dehalococcoidia bacterium]